MLTGPEISEICSFVFGVDVFQGGNSAHTAGGIVILSTKLSKNKMLNSFIIVNFLC